MSIKEWTNGLGADATRDGVTIELWRHGGATVTVADHSATGRRGTHYATFGYLPDMTWEAFADLAFESWQNSREDWTPCNIPHQYRESA